MALIDDLLKKMVTLNEEFALRKFSLRSVWMFYKCYNLSINILGYSVNNGKDKERIWKNLINAVMNKNLKNEKKYHEKLLNYMGKDLIIINDAILTTEEDNEKLGIQKSTLWKKGVIGFPNWEVEEREGFS